MYFLMPSKKNITPVSKVSLVDVEKLARRAEDPSKVGVTTQ